MEHYFIGIDGGGSNTRVRLVDADDRVLAETRSGPSNVAESVADAWSSIHQALAQALNIAGFNLRDKNRQFHIAMGLAGTEVKQAKLKFLSVSHPFTSLVVKSDAYVACMGAHGGQDGAIVIIGTGVIGYLIENGEVSRVGGWGFPHADEGGGAWLGKLVSRLTFKCLDGRIDPTPLLTDVLARFDNNIDAFVAWANQARRKDFAQLAPLITQHLNDGDPHALSLIRAAVSEIEEVIAALDQRRPDQNLQPLPLCLMGGVSNFIAPRISKELQARLVVPKGDGCQGALMLAKQCLAKQAVKQQA